MSEAAGLKDALPLSGRKIVVTRAAEQAGSFAGMLRRAGAEVVEFPTIETVPPESYESLDGAIDGLAGFDYALFTSANAVKFFVSRMKVLGRDASELAGLKLIAVGPKTAREIEALGLTISVTPAEYKAEGVLDALGTHDLAGKRVLFPRAERAREILPEELAGRGAEVVVAVAYRTVAPKVDPAWLRRLFADGGVSAVTFTSSSTVRNFVGMVGEEARGYLKGVCVACIGPVTAKTCEEMGIDVCVVPEDYTVDALLAALSDYFGRRKSR